MFAQMEYDPVMTHKTELVLYRTEADARERQNWLLRFDLDNKQLSELVVVQKIEVVDTDAD
jgi:hypothetical protein